MNFGEVRRAQLAKSTLLTSSFVPLGSFKVCSDAKERVGCGKQREATAPIKSLQCFQPKKISWQSLFYVASWNGGPGSFDSYGWLRGERRACHNKVITRPAGLKVPVWQLWVATDCKQWPWLGFCQNCTSLVALWLDTFILCFTSSIFRSSLAHLFRDHLWVELL